MSSSSIGVVLFIQVCHVGRRGSLGIFGCTVVVVGVIRCRWVHSSAPWGSSSSFGDVGFIQVRPRIHSGSLGLFGCDGVVVGFIRGRLVDSGAP